MPTPNYGFEKRKRELAKKAAKEAKKLRKESKPPASETPDSTSPDSATPEISADAAESAATGESPI